MEKNCLNCKWYYNRVCNNFDVSITQELDNDGVSYVENGHLSEVIREGINFKEIITLILDQLENNEIIKKSYYGNYNNFKKILDKLDVESFSNAVTENINIIVGKAIMSDLEEYALVGEGGKLNIHNPDEFHCSLWE